MFGGGVPTAAPSNGSASSANSSRVTAPAPALPSARQAQIASAFLGTDAVGAGAIGREHSPGFVDDAAAAATVVRSCSAVAPSLDPVWMYGGGVGDGLRLASDSQLNELMLGAEHGLDAIESYNASGAHHSGAICSTGSSAAGGAGGGGGGMVNTLLMHQLSDFASDGRNSGPDGGGAASRPSLGGGRARGLMHDSFATEQSQCVRFHHTAFAPSAAASAAAAATTSARAGAAARRAGTAAATASPSSRKSTDSVSPARRGKQRSNHGAFVSPPRSPSAGAAPAAKGAERATTKAAAASAVASKVVPESHLFLLNLGKTWKSQRPDVQRAIAELGGRVTESPSECTHYVVERPKKDLSLLMAVTRGVWVLAPSFLDASIAGNGWADAAAHEWTAERFAASLAARAAAAPGALGDAATKPMQERSLCVLIDACRWHRRASAANLPGGRPFAGWRAAIVLEDPTRRAGFARILVAGGCDGEPLVAPNFQDITVDVLRGLTHVLVDEEQNDVAVSLRDQLRLPPNLLLRIDVIVWVLGHEAQVEAAARAAAADAAARSRTRVTVSEADIVARVAAAEPFDYAAHRVGSRNRKGGAGSGSGSALAVAAGGCAAPARRQREEITVD